jgi:hypothetical protein
MNIVINNEGFVLYATPFPVPGGELSTTVELPANLVKPRLVDNKWVEGATLAELTEIKAKKVAVLNEEYTEKIDKIVSVHVQKNIIDGTAIPTEILEAREALRAEYHQKINQ